MDDYISRQAAIDELMKTVKNNSRDRFGGALIHWTGVKAILTWLPAADVRPVVRSEWIMHDNRTWYCKRCKSWIPDEQRYYANWCLFCGADMREKPDGNDDHDPG